MAATRTSFFKRPSVNEPYQNYHVTSGRIQKFLLSRTSRFIVIMTSTDRWSHLHTASSMKRLKISSIRLGAGHIKQVASCWRKQCIHILHFLQEVNKMNVTCTSRPSFDLLHKCSTSAFPTLPEYIYNTVYSSSRQKEVLLLLQCDPPSNLKQAM